MRHTEAQKNLKKMGRILCDGLPTAFDIAGLEYEVIDRRYVVVLKHHADLAVGYIFYGEAPGRGELLAAVGWMAKKARAEIVENFRRRAHGIIL